MNADQRHVALALEAPVDQHAFDIEMAGARHVTKAPTLDSGQPGIGKVGRVDRADEPFDCLEPVKRHFVAWDRSSHRFAWLRVAEKRQLRDELYARAQRRKIADRSKMT